MYETGPGFPQTLILILIAIGHVKLAIEGCVPALTKPVEPYVMQEAHPIKPLASPGAGFAVYRVDGKFVKLIDVRQ